MIDSGHLNQITKIQDIDHKQNSTYLHIVYIVIDQCAYDRDQQ